MPNWCSNRLTITGPEEDISKIRAALVCHTCENLTECAWGSPIQCAFTGVFPQPGEDAFSEFGILLHAIAETDSPTPELVTRLTSWVEEEAEDPAMDNGTNRHLLMAAFEASGMNDFTQRLPLFPAFIVGPSWTAHALLAGLSERDVERALSHDDPGIRSVAHLGTVAFALEDM